MAISFRCETCRQTIHAPDGSDGRLARCPGCYSVVQIPFERKTVAKAAKQTVPPEDPLGIEGTFASRWDEVYGHVDPSDRPKPPRNKFADDPEDTPQEQPPKSDLPVTLTPDQVDRRRIQLVLVSSLLLLASAFSIISLTISIVLSGYALFNSYNLGQIPILGWFGMVIMLGFQIATFRCLIAARFRGRYALAVTGMALSMVPLFNLTAMLAFPFSLWGLGLLANPQLRILFRGEGDELDYLREEQFQYRRERLVLIASFLEFISAGIAVMMVLALLSSIATIVSKGSYDGEELVGLVGLFIMLFLHLTTICCLNEARTFGSFRMAIAGLALSLIPPFSVEALVLFPLSIWGLILIMSPGMHTLYRSHWGRMTE